MDQKLKETMIKLVKNSSEEEIVGLIMTQILKNQLLERKVGKLEQEISLIRLQVEVTESERPKNLN
jgi:hypothetical protein